MGLFINTSTSVPPYSLSPQIGLWFHIVPFPAPNPNSIMSTALSLKVLFSLAFHPFIFAPVWNKLISTNQPSAFFTSDADCQVIAPLEINGLQPVSDLRNVHSAPRLSLVTSFPISFLRYSKLSPISANPFPNPVTLSRFFGENGSFLK